MRFLGSVALLLSLVFASSVALGWKKAAPIDPLVVTSVPTRPGGLGQPAATPEKKPEVIAVKGKKKRVRMAKKVRPAPSAASPAPSAK